MHGLIYGRRHKRYQLSVSALLSSDDCDRSNHHGSYEAAPYEVISGLLFCRGCQTWNFFALPDAKAGRYYRTAWLLHHKITQAMSEREEAYVLRERSRWMTPTLAEAKWWKGWSGIPEQSPDRGCRLP
jgi:hypothetical protein